MPDFNVINRVVKYLYRQGMSPTGIDVQQSTFLKQLFQKNLQAEQEYRRQKEFRFQQAALTNAPMMIIQSQPQQQRYTDQQKMNQAMNIASMVNKLIKQGHKLADLMVAANQFMMQARQDQEQNRASAPEHKGKGKEHTKEGANNDGSMDDEFLADVDGDGVVTDFERKNLENFLVTKVQEKEPTFNAESFREAQENGERMEGSELGAKQLMVHMITNPRDTLNAAQTAVDIASGNTPKKSSLPNPFPMKPEPPTSV